MSLNISDKLLYGSFSIFGFSMANYTYWQGNRMLEDDRQKIYKQLRQADAYAFYGIALSFTLTSTVIAIAAITSNKIFII